MTSAKYSPLDIPRYELLFAFTRAAFRRPSMQTEFNSYTGNNSSSLLLLTPRYPREDYSESEYRENSRWTISAEKLFQEKFTGSIYF